MKLKQRKRSAWMLRRQHMGARSKIAATRCAAWVSPTIAVAGSKSVAALAAAIAGVHLYYLLISLTPALSVLVPWYTVVGR